MTTNPRRVSIGLLCVVIAVVAVDLAWWRHITAYSRGAHSLLGFRGPALDAGAMPMASVLVVGLAYVLTNRGRVPRRIVGVLRGGLAGLIVYLTYNWACLVLPPDLVAGSMRPIYGTRDWLRRHSIEPRDYLYYADIIYYGTPQFALALLGGVIAGRGEAIGGQPDAAPIADGRMFPKDDR